MDNHRTTVCNSGTLDCPCAIHNYSDTFKSLWTEWISGRSKTDSASYNHNNTDRHAHHTSPDNYTISNTGSDRYASADTGTSSDTTNASTDRHAYSISNPHTDTYANSTSCTRSSSTGLSGQWYCV